MIKNTDDKCRVIIPLDFRRELNIEPNQKIEIELVGKKIIISNPQGIMNKDEIETMYNDVRKMNPNEYNKGFQDALKMILKK